jgi:hypothetical protein
MHSERAARHVLTRRSAIGLGAAMATGSCFSWSFDTPVPLVEWFLNGELLCWQMTAKEPFSFVATMSGIVTARYNMPSYGLLPINFDRIGPEVVVFPGDHVRANDIHVDFDARTRELRQP